MYNGHPNGNESRGTNKMNNDDLHVVFSIERQMVEFDDKTLKIEQLEIQGPPTAFHFSSNVEQCFHNLNLLWPCCLQAQNWPS